VGETETPRPDPQAVEGLLRAVRAAAPGLATLHVDNANPAVIAEHPEEAEEVTGALVRHCTSGNVAAFGMESADPDVVRANNLNARPEDVVAACRILNRHGAARGASGLPMLLPGINVVFGLLGETRRTYELDLAFLRGLLDEGLLVRRINVRVVVPYPGTRLAREAGDRIARRHHSLIMTFRRRIREEVDVPMLRRVAPVGTALSGLRAEISKGAITFLRQPGTYPLTAAMRAPAARGSVLDGTVVDHRERSVVVVPHPLDPNSAPPSLLTTIPGVGRRWAARIVRGRPYLSAEGLAPLLAEMSEPGPLAAALGLPPPHKA
jgi:radical SAM superfamily enzyme with C-terminal helix-hairpin-helix motif